MQLNYVKVFSLVTALALVSTGSAAVAQGGRPAAKDRKPVVYRLSCANGGTSDKEWAGPRDAVAGPVRIGNGLHGAQYPPRHFRQQRDGFFRLKAPVRVDAGERVRIELAPVNRGHAWLAYGAPADVLDIVACSEMKYALWIGTIMVDGPQCVRLRVIHRGTTSILRLPFGRGTCGEA